MPLVVGLTTAPATADAVATVLPADGLRLRAGPGTDHPILDLIPGGTRIAITGQATADGWFPAVYRAQRGWVLGAYLAFDDLTVATARRAAVVPADGLNLRTAPLETADAVAVLPAGALVTVPGGATSDGWALVFVAEQAGWVNAAYLAFEGQPAGSAPAPSASVATAAAPSGGTRMKVSYYHPSFEGGRMACGGIYRSDDVAIAATNTWPCGTVLRVCTGGACVVATVRDRGAMAPDEMDLSMAGFARLAPLSAGQITATVEVLGRE